MAGQVATSGDFKVDPFGCGNGVFRRRDEPGERQWRHSVVQLGEGLRHDYVGKTGRVKGVQMACNGVADGRATTITTTLVEAAVLTGARFLLDTKRMESCRPLPN